ncbi:MAG: cysteine methyltransferase, partial [Bacteroidia bacterium]|nr:cysteine methyltransferase [Bacteroidia bacterium]
MASCLVNTPLGTTLIEGDQDGIRAISIIEDSEPDQEIPEYLQPCAHQLLEYFEDSRRNFDLKLN